VIAVSEDLERKLDDVSEGRELPFAVKIIRNSAVERISWRILELPNFVKRQLPEHFVGLLREGEDRIEIVYHGKSITYRRIRDPTNPDYLEYVRD